MFPIERRKKITEPKWKQSEKKMLLTIQDCEMIIDRLESVQDDLASWFENCGMNNLSGKQVAQIIRKWRPE